MTVLKDFYNYFSHYRLLGLKIMIGIITGMCFVSLMIAVSPLIASVYPICNGVNNTHIRDLGLMYQNYLCYFQGLGLLITCISSIIGVALTFLILLDCGYDCEKKMTDDDSSSCESQD